MTIQAMMPIAARLNLGRHVWNHLLFGMAVHAMTWMNGGHRLRRHAEFGVR